MDSKKGIMLPHIPRFVPILPMAGLVLMPKSQIPVPVYEEEYMVLAETVLKEHGYIGIIQPILNRYIKGKIIPLFKTGCVGQITDVEELDDGRVSLTITGICRFSLIREKRTKSMFRMGEIDCTPYQDDLLESEISLLERRRLKRALSIYFKKHELEPNWNEINKTPNARLISALAMICPFASSEKQALLEAKSMSDQSKTLTTLIEIASMEPRFNEDALSHGIVYH